MSQVSENKLVLCIQNGDPAALSDLLERYQHRLFNVALRMLGNRDDAAEITQEAMIKIIEHIGDYNAKSQISTWMIRIVMNLSISHLRKQKLRRAASLEGSNGSADAENDGYDGVASLRLRMADVREPGPGSRVETKEMLEHLEQAMEQLDDDFRAAIVLRDLNGMDYQQMADVLGIPVGTVKSRLFRARVALREIMLNLYPTQRPDTPLPSPDSMKP